MQDNNIRPTKKQKELLSFIESWIAEHGYSPSYREIMSGQGYTSVATVALHVNNLIKRGHLAKRDHSARSLEVVKAGAVGSVKDTKVISADSKWLFDEIEQRFAEVQKGKGNIDELYVLVGAVNVLGFAEVGRSFAARLKELTT